MIETGRLKIKFFLLVTMLFLISLNGCAPKNDINTVLQDYYEALDPDHYKDCLNLIIMQKTVDTDTTFVLVYNRINEVDSQFNVFMLDNESNITHHTTAENLIGPCYSVNSFIFENRRIVFGILVNGMHDKNSDDYISVNLTNIELKFSDGLTINQDITGN